MTAPIHTTFGFSIYLLSFKKCRIHQSIIFWIGINTKTRPIDKIDDHYYDGLHYNSSH